MDSSSTLFLIAYQSHPETDKPWRVMRMRWDKTGYMSTVAVGPGFAYEHLAQDFRLEEAKRER